MSGRRRKLANEFAAPTTLLQQSLARLWAEVLGVQPIGIHDDFFELGGHSLLAVELLELLSREMGLRVSARTLYLQPTIAELENAVSELYVAGPGKSRGEP
jgi:hypothetical protein